MGENIVTTCDTCRKESIPGTGLLPKLHQESTTITLADMVERPGEYPRPSCEEQRLKGELTEGGRREAIMTGAVLQVRLKAMTVSVIVAGLQPIFFSEGTG